VASGAGPGANCRCQRARLGDGQAGWVERLERYLAVRLDPDVGDAAHYGDVARFHVDYLIA
jgi:hypothetical protein